MSTTSSVQLAARLLLRVGVALTLLAVFCRLLVPTDPTVADLAILASLGLVLVCGVALKVRARAEGRADRGVAPRPDQVSRRPRAE